VSFPEIKGAHTYGRSLNQLRRRIPEVLRLWDRDPARVQIVEVLDLPASLRQAISTATAQRREAEEQSQAAQRELERTIRRLQSQLKIGVRDTGELLQPAPISISANPGDDALRELAAVCTQAAPPEAGGQRSVAPSTSVDSPCSSSCSNPAEDSCKSGRSGRVDLKNRTEKRRNRHVWTEWRLIRDREAPGSNPGPPTKI